MFNNFNNNKKMITGAYKKLKSYFYYDKTTLFNKMRCATWEHSQKNMEHQIDELANFLCSLESNPNLEYLSILIKQISLIPMPKSFNDDDSKGKIITNKISTGRKLEKINFYIKAPIELLVLDMIWTLMISKIAYDQGVLNKNIYANRLKEKQVFNDNYDLVKGIDFDSNRLFYPYFKQYSSWRNNAFETVKKRYENNQNSVLISLDIKSYYYSVIFDFESLPILLKNDTRLNSIERLTDVIKDIHIFYTAEMQKYRTNISADCKRNESALPIGLTSSMVLANLYLKDFDDEICNKVNPTYYGRYVDDILLVIDKTDDIDISQDSIIEKVFIKNDIVETRENSYHILVPNGDLSLQKDKIRCIYFDHNEPDAMIKLLCESSNLKPSMSDGFLMPDIDLTERNFDEYAYSIGEVGGTLKVRDFLFSTNNYGASLFLNDLIKASKNVNVSDEYHYQYIEQQLNQILRFYSSQQAIEFRTAWTNIFNLILINKRYDYFIKFYDQLYHSIYTITADKVDNISFSKLEYILNKLKESLHEQLYVSASIALAPHALSIVEEQIKICCSEKINSAFAEDCDIVFSNASDIRNANMFNHHILAFPLISHISTDNSNISLVNVDFHTELTEIIKQELDSFKINYSPRFIHLDEIYLWEFITRFSTGGNPFKNRILSLNERFSHINQIVSPIKTFSEEETQTENESLQIIKITDSLCEDKLKIALASIYIDEINDVVPVLKNSTYNLSPNKKSELYRMLNEAKLKGAQMIVFPEFYMPIQWVQEILYYSRRNQITIISGLRYLVNNGQAYNYLAIFQPFSSDGFKYSIPLFREKNHYAPAEKIGVAKEQLCCYDPKIKSTQLVSWNGIKYSNLMCYELTNIEWRYALRGLIDLLVIPELNKDTGYFSNMVESTTRDLHTFVVQVNTSKYGDSRITGPYNSLFKDIIKLKGGEDNLVLTCTISLSDIENTRKNYLKILDEKINAAYNGELKKPKSPKRTPKDPVAGFQKEV